MLPGMACGEKCTAFPCVAKRAGAAFPACQAAIDEFNGLAVVQAAKMAGAAKIYAIDTNAAKFDAAVDLGATDCVNPSELGDKPVQQHLVEE